jgi:hypothetical protein
MEIIELITNYGAVALLFYLFIKEFFGYLKKDKKGISREDSHQEVEIALLKQKTEQLESNHLVHQKAIEDSLKENIEDHNFIKGCIIKIATKLGVDVEIK